MCVTLDIFCYNRDMSATAEIYLLQWRYVCYKRYVCYNGNVSAIIEICLLQQRYGCHNRDMFATTKICVVRDMFATTKITEVYMFATERKICLASTTEILLLQQKYV
jgi:hypothetical protein